MQSARSSPNRHAGLRLPRGRTGVAREVAAPQGDPGSLRYNPRHAVRGRFHAPVPILAMSRRTLNILQVCDHLGWEGSRMHGVKRLFGWMIPRFDRDRFNVSLVSLRRKDLSEETLDRLGIDITYLNRSKFDPRTLRDLLDDRRPQADRRPAPARLRRDDVRPDGRRAAPDSDDPPRARQPHRHALVSEDRRPGASSRSPTSRSPSRRAPPSSCSRRARCGRRR